MKKLPVSIISPVRDCSKEMRKHAAHLRKLAQVAEEVIVVDSESRDGTLEILREELAGVEVTFLNHPPGLYESWNHAIAAAKAPYCTVATVGDILEVQDLGRLWRTMEEFGPDVVVSPPRLLEMDGGFSPRRWPIHQILSASGLDRVAEVSGVAWFVMTLGYFPASLISSSAGNLYRTAFLKEHPFPCEYGHPGDCVWALQRAFDAKWVIDPGVKATFLMHPPGVHRKPKNEKRAAAMREMVLSLFERNEPILRGGGVPEELLDALREAPHQVFRKTCAHLRYGEVRKRYMPWFLQAEAVRLKRERNGIARLIEARKKLVREYAKSYFSGLGREAGS